jgi:cytochrome c-type biogenesis protein CcmH/NrfG
VMYYLGILYFQQGRTAQGLQVYDKLSKLHDQNAASLLTHYDAFSMEAFG